MQILSSLGALGYTALGLIIGYFNPPTNPNRNKSRPVIDWECDHEWSTCLEDKSPHDDFDCYITDEDGHFGGEVFWRCERCQLKTNVQAVKIDSTIIGHGNRTLVGRLSFNAFENKLIDATND